MSNKDRDGQQNSLQKIDLYETLLNKLKQNQFNLVGGSSKAGIFNKMRKFLNEMSKKLGGDTIISLSKAKTAIKDKQFSNKEIEDLYYKTTGEHLSVQRIIDNVDQMIMIMQEITIQNQQVYVKLQKECEKYLRGIQELKQMTTDLEFTSVLDTLLDNFIDVKKLIEFTIQKTIGGKISPSKFENLSYDNKEDQELFKKLYSLSEVLKGSIISKKQTTQKYFDKLIKQLGTNPKNMSNTKMLVRLISKFPLLVETDYLDINKFKGIVQDVFLYVYRTSDKKQKEQFIQKLNILLQKMLTKEDMNSKSQIVGGSNALENRTIFRKISQNNYKKDQRVQLFKQKTNRFFVNVIKQFFLLIDEKTIKDFYKIDVDLKPTLIDLADIYSQLIENDLQYGQIITFIRQEDKENVLEYEGILYRLKYLQEQMEDVIKNIDNRQFQVIIQQIIKLIDEHYKYIYKIIYQTNVSDDNNLLEEDELLGRGFIETIDDDDEIRKQYLENIQFLDIIQNFIIVSQMQKNINRIRKEIKTVDQERYTKGLTMETIKLMSEKCEKYYQKIEDFYNGVDCDKDAKIKYDPVLSKYLYHVLLRFQSASYISKGLSAHPIINPRYFLNGRNAEGGNMNVGLAIADATLFDEGSELLNPAAAQLRRLIANVGGPNPYQRVLAGDVTNVNPDGTPMVVESNSAGIPCIFNRRPVGGAVYNVFDIQNSFTYADEQVNRLQPDQWFRGSKFTYARWYYNSKCLGILEELDAENQKYFSKMQIREATTVDQYIPKIPNKMDKMEKLLSDQLTGDLDQANQIRGMAKLYQNLKQNSNIYDIISASPALAKEHLYQLAHYQVMLGNFGDGAQIGQQVIGGGIRTIALEGVALASPMWNGPAGMNAMEQNSHQYTFLTSNPFSVIRLEKPSIVARLMNTKEDRVRWNQELDKELFIVLFQKLYQNAKSLLDIQLVRGIYNPRQYKTYASFCNKILDEYLIPEIQLPFVNQTLKDQVLNVYQPGIGGAGPAPLNVQQANDMYQTPMCREVGAPADLIYENQHFEIFEKYYNFRARPMLRQTTHVYDFDTEVYETLSNVVYEPEDLDGLPSHHDRILFDSINIQKQVDRVDYEYNQLFPYSGRQVLPVIPMFGDIKLMPVWEYNNKKVGCLISDDCHVKNQEQITQTWNQIDKLQTYCDRYINSLFDRCAINLETRSAHGIENIPDVALVGGGFPTQKRHCILFGFDVPQRHTNDECHDPQCPVYKSKVNRSMEFQLHMSQHLQQFTLQDQRLIFDPLVRKQMFQTFVKIYNGEDILPGLDRNIYSQYDNVTRRYVNPFEPYRFAPVGGPMPVLPNSIFRFQEYNVLNPQLRTSQPINGGVGFRYVHNQPYVTFGRTFGHIYLKSNPYAKTANNQNPNRRQQIVIAGFPYNQTENADEIAEYIKPRDGRLFPNVLGIRGRAGDYLSRQFTAISDDPRVFVGEHGVPYFSKFPKVLSTQAGLLKIPQEYIENQPRVSMGIYLRDSENFEVRNKFIQACDKKDPQMIQNNILRVNKEQLEKLKDVLTENDNQTGVYQGLFRIYLSESIRLQYFSNHQVLTRTEPLKALDLQTEDNKKNLKLFKDLVSDVLKIKKIGYLSLLSLADTIDGYLGAQVENIVDHKLKLDDIKDMLAKLYIHYQKSDKQQSSPFSDQIKSCLNANQYLRIYSQQSVFGGMFKKDDRKRLYGGKRNHHPRYNYDVVKYYEDIKSYIEEMKTTIKGDIVIKNFVKMFTLICQQMTESQKTTALLDSQQIEQAVCNYLLSSCVEIDQSIMEFDFDVQLEPSKTNGHTQFKFQTDGQKKTKIIGIDAIYIPQNWKLSNNLEDTTLVPHHPNECTRDLDILYNNILNAMGQKLVNILGLYRMQIKKKNDLQITRLLIGAGKKHHKRSKSQSHTYRDETATDSLVSHSQKSLLMENPMKLQPKIKDFNIKQFELYFRTLLLCSYYTDLFKNDKKSRYEYIDNDEPDVSKRNKFLMLYLDISSQDGSENKIPQLLSIFRKRSKQASGMIFTKHILDKVISIIDDIYNSVQATNNYQVYDKIVEYVNLNYRIMDNTNQEEIDKQKLEQENQEILGIRTDRPPLFEDDLKDQLFWNMGIDTKKEVGSLKTSKMLDLDATKQLIQKQLDSLVKVIQNSSTIDNSLVRMFRSLKYELTNASREKKVDKLLSLLNKKDQYRDRSELGIFIHDQIIFGMSILNQFHTLTQFLKDFIKDVVVLRYPDGAEPTDQQKNITHQQIFQALLRKTLGNFENVYVHHDPAAGAAIQVKINQQNDVYTQRLAGPAGGDDPQQDQDFIMKLIFSEVGLMDKWAGAIDENIHAKQQDKLIQILQQKYRVIQDILSTLIDENLVEVVSKITPDFQGTLREQFIIDSENLQMYLKALKNILIQNIKFQRDGQKSERDGKNYQEVEENNKLPTQQNIIDMVDGINDFFKKFEPHQEQFTSKLRGRGADVVMRLKDRAIMEQQSGVIDDLKYTSFLYDKDIQDEPTSNLRFKQPRLGEYGMDSELSFMRQNRPNSDEMSHMKFKFDELQQDSRRVVSEPISQQIKQEDKQYIVQLENNMEETIQKVQESDEFNPEIYGLDNKQTINTARDIDKFVQLMTTKDAKILFVVNQSIFYVCEATEQQIPRNIMLIVESIMKKFPTIGDTGVKLKIIDTIVKQVNGKKGVYMGRILTFYPKLITLKEPILQKLKDPISKDQIRDSQGLVDMFMKYLNDTYRIDEQFTNKLLQGGRLQPVEIQRTLKVTKQMKFDDYIVFTLFDHHHNDIFVLNKILRNLIDNTVVLSKVPKIYSRIFQGIWDGNNASSDYEVILKYSQIHDEKRKQKEKVRTFQDTDPTNSYESKHEISQVVGVIGAVETDKTIQYSRLKTDVFRLTNPVRRDEMIDGLLYDGYNDKVDEFNIQEILVHNYQQMENLQTFFTSSIVNFASEVIKSNQSLIGETKNMSHEAQQLTSIDPITEKAVVCSCIQTSFQLHCLLQKIGFKIKSFEQIQQDIYSKSEEKKLEFFYYQQQTLLGVPVNSIERDFGALSQYDYATQEQLIRNIKEKLISTNNQQMTQLSQLKEVVTRVRSRIDDYIRSKQQYIPNYLSETMEQEYQKSLYSNLYYLINLQDFETNTHKPQQEFHKYIFAKYFFNRMQSDEQQVQKDLIKEFGKHLQPAFIKVSEPLIWYLSQINVKLRNSVFNSEGIQQEFMFLNPPTYIQQEIEPRNFKLPYWLRDKQLSQFASELQESKYFQKYKGHNSIYLARFPNQLLEHINNNRLRPLLNNALIRGPVLGYVGLDLLQSERYRPFADHISEIYKWGCIGADDQYIMKGTEILKGNVILFDDLNPALTAVIHAPAVFPPFQLPYGQVTVGSSTINFDSHRHANEFIQKLNVITHNYFINRAPDNLTEAQIQDLVNQQLYKWTSLPQAQQEKERKFLNQSYRINLQQLPVQLRSQLQKIENTIITKNTALYDYIIQRTINQRPKTIEIYNIIDLGIIPLNLNMLKHDVPLLNISLNSALYKMFIDNLQSVPDLGTIFGDVSNDITRDILKKIAPSGLDPDNVGFSIFRKFDSGVLRDNKHLLSILTLANAQEVVGNQITKYLSHIGDLQTQDELKYIVTKFNEFDMAMNFRLNIGMLLILTYMITTGVEKTGKDVLLSGFDAILQPRQKLVNI